MEYKTWMDDLLTGLKGDAWDVVEPLARLDLSGHHVQARFWRLLDEAFQYDPRTEIINRFEEFLFKYKRGRKDAAGDRARPPDVAIAARFLALSRP